MPINFGLLEQQFNPVDALRQYGLAQQQQMQQQEMEMRQAKLKTEQQKAAQLQAAYDPQTGKLDRRQVSQTLISAGDLDGYREFNKGLQGEQAEAADRG